MHRMGNGIVGKFPPQLLFQLLHHGVTLLRAFGKPFQHLITDTLNLKARLGRLNPAADLLQPFRQFIPIDRRAVTDGVIHAARLQGFPRAFVVIKRGVEHREVRVQLRVEGAAARVRERRSGEIASDPILLASSCAVTSRSSASVTASTETDFGAEQLKS